MIEDHFRVFLCVVGGKGGGVLGEEVDVGFGVFVGCDCLLERTVVGYFLGRFFLETKGAAAG